MKNKFLFILALLMLLTVTAGCDLSAVLHIFQDQDGTVDISQYTGYAYKQLDQQEQNIYRQLAVAIDEQQQQIEDVPEDMSAAEFTDIVQAVLADFPGYFWYAGEELCLRKKISFCGSVVMICNIHMTFPKDEQGKDRLTMLLTNFWFHCPQ